MRSFFLSQPVLVQLHGDLAHRLAEQGALGLDLAVQSIWDIDGCLHGSMIAVLPYSCQSGSCETLAQVLPKRRTEAHALPGHCKARHAFSVTNGTVLTRRHQRGHPDGARSSPGNGCFIGSPPAEPVNAAFAPITP